MIFLVVNGSFYVMRFCCMIRPLKTMNFYSFGYAEHSKFFRKVKKFTELYFRCACQCLRRHIHSNRDINDHNSDSQQPNHAHPAVSTTQKENRFETVSRTYYYCDVVTDKSGNVRMIWAGDEICPFWDSQTNFDTIVDRVIRSQTFDFFPI